MISGIFNKKKEYTNPSDMEKVRMIMDHWMQTEWEMCCKHGLEKTYAFLMGRRLGSTTMMHNIAVKGFEPQLNIVTIHVNERTKKMFQNIDLDTTDKYDAMCAKDVTKENLVDYDVILVDSVEHMKKETISSIMSKKNNATIILFDSDLCTVTVDYKAVGPIKIPFENLDKIYDEYFLK